MLCAICHILCSTQVEPKVFKAMMDAGLEGFPDSWKMSIYEQAAKASAEGLERERGTETGRRT